MAQKNISPAAAGAETSAPLDRLRSSLKNPKIAELIHANSHAAEENLRLGPSRMGWANNEAVRPRYEALAEFWRALESLY